MSSLISYRTTSNIEPQDFFLKINPDEVRRRPRMRMISDQVGGLLPGSGVPSRMPSAIKAKRLAPSYLFFRGVDGAGVGSMSIDLDENSGRLYYDTLSDD
jgi:hypothetical protein